MSMVILKSDISVTIQENGVMVLKAPDGKVFYMSIGPDDLKVLKCFLAAQGYKWAGEL